jgi:hypothetical protein
VKVAEIADRVSTDPSLEEMFLSYYSEKSPEALPP